MKTSTKLINPSVSHGAFSKAKEINSLLAFVFCYSCLHLCICRQHLVTSGRALSVMRGLTKGMPGIDTAIQISRVAIGRLKIFSWPRAITVIL